jgi:gliding motility-associated-like protein
VTDITPATGTGTNGAITETLSNSSSDPKTVTYLLTPTGPLNKNCKGKATPFKVTVAPIPTISSTLLNQKVCSGLPYNYIAQSLVKKSTFTWTRAVGTNVTNAAATGSDSTISETLLNNTTQAGTVTYVLIPKGPAPTACAGVNANLTVTVNPLPKITSADKDTVCSDALFTYQITTGLATTPSFTWKRAQIGVNTAKQGTSNPIQETLISTSNQIASYMINATTAEGCTNLADTTLSVLISSLPTGKLSMPAQMCDGDTKELTATITGVAPFDYTISGGGMVAESVVASSLTTTKRNVTPGAGTATYAITNLKDATGCTSVSMSGISTQVNPLPKATIGLDQTICQGTSASLAFDLSNGTSTYDVTYQYYPVSSPGTITTVNLTKLSGPTSSILVSPSNSTVYKIKTVKDTDKGCPAVIDPLNEAIVTVTPRPNALVAAPVTSIICSGGTPNLSLSSNVVGTETGTSFKWVATSPSNKIKGYTNSSGGNNTIVDVIENDLGRESSVTYTITPNYLSCDGASIPVKINVRAKTEPTLVEQINICPTTPITVKTSSFVGGSYSWNVDPPVPFTSTDENLTMTLNQDEMVQVVYEDICLIKHYSPWVWLKVKQSVTIAFTNGDICMASVTPFTPNNISDVSNKTEIDGWKWNFGNYITTGDSALSTKLHPETTFQYNSAGTYNVTLQAYSEGCEVGKVVQPIKIKDCTVKVTNTLTPNEDGSNDEWIIKEIENYPTAGVEIFNRWGVLIWSCEGNCASKRFSGRNEQGQELEQGTYYYVLTLNKGKSIMRGYITVIRDPGN